MKPANTDFARLQAEIGCTGKWLAEQLGYSEEHISMFRTGRRPVPRVVLVAMLALASGWRP